jgi:DNA-binding transcriptional regulator PaaX
MNESKLRARLLTHLFDRGQAAETTDLIDLARNAGASARAVLAALRSLEHAGLVDARRLRLTLPGLALVAAFARGRRAGDERASPRPGRPLPTGRHAA